MAAKKSTKKRSATKAPRKSSPRKAVRAREENPDAPTYTTDAEVKAARLAHGPHYDRSIARGLINAPTTEELSHAELDARLAKADAKREAKHAGAHAGKSASRSSRAKRSPTTDAAPASEAATAE